MAQTEVIRCLQWGKRRPNGLWRMPVTPLFLEEFKTCQANAFHLNGNRKFSNNLIGLHFMACIFLFLSPMLVLFFKKI
jgi:hypothetical protein